MKLKKLIVTILVVCMGIMAVIPANAYVASNTASATASGDGCGFYSVLSTNVTHVSFSSYAKCSGTPTDYIDVHLTVSVDGTVNSKSFRYPDDGSSKSVSEGNGVTASTAKGYNTFMFHNGSVETKIVWNDGVFTVY